MRGYVTKDVVTMLRELGFTGFSSKSLTGEYNLAKIEDVMMWLREKNDIHIGICMGKEVPWEYRFWKISTREFLDWDMEAEGFDRYEEAANSALRVALGELLKERKLLNIIEDNMKRMNGSVNEVEGNEGLMPGGTDEFPLPDDLP